MGVVLKLLRKELEQGFEVTQFSPGQLPGRAPGGQPYVIIAGAGGEDEARAAFHEYANGKGHKLFWRTWPEASDRGEFYMRLLVTT